VVGRPPKPIEAHKRDGTYDESKHGELVVLGDRGAADAPLTLPNEMIDLWNEVVEEIEPILQTSDRYAVEQFVICIARMREAQAHIDDNGVMVQGHGGKWVKNQALEVERHYMQLSISLGNLLGLSPSARARLGLMAIAGKSGLQKLEDGVGESPMNEPPPGV